MEIAEVIDHRDARKIQLSEHIWNLGYRGDSMGIELSPTASDWQTEVQASSRRENSLKLSRGLCCPLGV